MIQITEHFRLNEFSQHERHGFSIEPYPLEWVEERLRPLCETLEAIRFELGGKTVKILSGYRSPGYNRVIGGKLSSQHVAGRAADFVVGGVTQKEVHDAVLKIYRAGFLPWLGGLGEYPRFTHIDVRPRIRLARWEGNRTES